MPIEPDTNPATRPKLFYGWIMVAALLFLLSVGWGTTVYMYSVVAGAVGAEFSASRLVLMMGSTGMLLMLAAASPALGRLLDRYPNKRILSAGAALMGIGFLVIAISPSIWVVIAAYVLLIGVGTASLSILTVSTLLTRWFVRHRGLAVGIAALGTQMGGFLYPPLFVSALEASSWRIAIGGMGLLILALVPLLTWLLIVDKPADKNQHPDGDSTSLVPTVKPSQDESVERLSFASLLRQSNFLLLVAIVGAAVAANTVLLANLSLFATDLGEAPVRGAFLVSLLALLGIFCSPLAGWLCDRMNIKLITALVTLSLASACFMYSIANTYSLLLIAVFLQGFGGGGVFPLWASLVGRLYPARVYGQVMGSATLVISVLTAMAPLFAGWIHDTTSSYRILFLILLFVLVLMCALTTLIRLPEQQLKIA